MKYLLLFLTIFLYFNVSSQIITEENTHKEPTEVETNNNKAKNKKDRGPREKTGIEVYAGVTPAYTFRTLKVNEGLFAKPIDYRAEEKGAWTVGYMIGARNPLNDFLKLDIGVGFSVNRETYDFTSNDSIYRYTNSYRHISIPIKLAYTYGDQFKFYAGIGIVPKAFLGLKNELTTFNQFKEEVTETEIIRDKLSLFLIDAVADVGMQMKLGPNVGLYVMLQGTRQLTNNYEKQGPYIRKGYTLGFSCGLEFYL